MISPRSSTLLCHLSWVVGEREFTHFRMRIPTYLVCIGTIVRWNVSVVNIIDKQMICTCVAVQPRSMDPSKDLAAYGYGSVAWKERMESWKQKQERLHQMRNDGGGKDWDGIAEDDDLALYDSESLFDLFHFSVSLRTYALNMKLNDLFSVVSFVLA
jgi:hypothetical protein